MKKLSLVLLLLLAGAGVGSWRAKAWWETETAPVTVSTQSTPLLLVEIPNGTSAQGIGALLAEKGIIRSPRAWQLWTRMQGWKNRSGGFQAGTYELSPGQSLEQVAQKIWTGQIATRSYTIPEGWSMQQMGEYFERQGMFTAAEFLNAVKQVPRQQYPWLPANLPHLEGFLYPDTYQIGATEKPSPQRIIQQMLNQFQSLALPVYEKDGKASGLSLLEWVTLASIVEKESVVARERRTIAGVFTNRLKKGMALGSDPTVEYGLGIRQTKEKPLTFAQVEMPSPYNTYMNPGLPPTPIASPGVPSLQATLNPEATEYLFFVARYDGTHVFSRTNAEHLAAQDKIRDRVEAEASAEPKAAADSKAKQQPAGSS